MAADMNTDATTHGKGEAAKAATAKHPATGAGEPCHRSSRSAADHAGDVPAADNQRKAQTMKETISAQWGLDDPDPRSADAAQVIEDAAWRDEGREIEAAFVSASGDEVIFSATDRSAEWEQLKQAAEAAAKRDGVNTAAMRDYAKAKGNGYGRELLPNTDWRTRAARRHGDKIVAAILYREAADLKDRRRQQHAERNERRRAAKMRDKAIAAWIRASGDIPTKKSVANISRYLDF